MKNLKVVKIGDSEFSFIYKGRLYISSPAGELDFDLSDIFRFQPVVGRCSDRAAREFLERTQGGGCVDNMMLDFVEYGGDDHKKSFMFKAKLGQRRYCLVGGFININLPYELLFKESKDDNRTIELRMKLYAFKSPLNLTTGGNPDQDGKSSAFFNNAMAEAFDLLRKIKSSAPFFDGWEFSPGIELGVVTQRQEDLRLVRLDQKRSSRIQYYSHKFGFPVVSNEVLMLNIDIKQKNFVDVRWNKASDEIARKYMELKVPTGGFRGLCHFLEEVAQEMLDINRQEDIKEIVEEFGKDSWSSSTWMGSGEAGYFTTMINGVKIGTPSSGCSPRHSLVSVTDDDRVRHYRKCFVMYKIAEKFPEFLWQSEKS